MKNFIADLSPEHIDSILSEDIVANDGFMSAAYNAAVSYSSFKDLRSNYTLRKAQIHKSITEIKAPLLKASTIHLSPSLNISVLATFLVEKNKLITKAMECLLVLKECLQKSPTMSNLRRRVTQQVKRERGELSHMDKVKCQCMNWTAVWMAAAS